MGYDSSLAASRAVACDGDDRPLATTADCAVLKAECLDQLLLAFRDIADFDDIHQASARLAIVQSWIRAETQRAASDPIIGEPAPTRMRMAEASIAGRGGCNSTARRRMR